MLIDGKWELTSGSQAITGSAVSEDKHDYGSGITAFLEGAAMELVITIEAPFTHASSADLLVEFVGADDEALTTNDLVYGAIEIPWAELSAADAKGNVYTAKISGSNKVARQIYGARYTPSTGSFTGGSVFVHVGMEGANAGVYPASDRSFV